MAKMTDFERKLIEKVAEARAKERSLRSELTMAAEKMVSDGMEAQRILVDEAILDALRGGARPRHIHLMGLGTSAANRVYEVKKRLELEPRPAVVDSVRMIEYLWAIEHDDLERDVAVFEVDGETVRVHRGETGADPITEEHNDERWNKVLADNHERFVAILREYLNS